MKCLSVGLDGGHSAFKIRAAFTSEPQIRISHQIPTIVTPAIVISNERTKARAELETIEVNDRKYFFGETALRQGRMDGYTGQNSDWIDSESHDVMILGAWRKIMQSVDKEPMRINLVLGLPAKYFSSQHEPLRHRVQSLLTPRLLPGQTLRVLIQSQSDAPLQWLSIRADGSVNVKVNLETEKWAVVEIGFHTTDYSLSDNGNLVEYASTSGPGVSMIYESLAPLLALEKMPSSIDVLEQIIRTGELVWFGTKRDLRPMATSAMSGFESVVLDQAERLFSSNAGLLNGLIVAGGGAELLFQKMKGKFPTAILPEQPRMIVAEGLCRLGLLAFSNS